MAAMERACRRARIPLAMSEGYNPRPRMSFPLALGVGVAGLNEPMELQLTDWNNPVRLTARLDDALPEGLDAHAWQYRHGQKFRARKAAYRIDLPGTLSPDTRRRLDDLNRQAAIPIVRRTEGKPDRRVDLRPFIDRLAVDGSQIDVTAHVTDRGTLRPEEVFMAIGDEPPPGARITRTDVEGD